MATGEGFFFNFPSMHNFNIFWGKRFVFPVFCPLCSPVTLISKNKGKERDNGALNHFFPSFSSRNVTGDSEEEEEEEEDEEDEEEGKRFQSYPVLLSRERGGGGEKVHHPPTPHKMTDVWEAKVCAMI